MVAKMDIDNHLIVKIESINHYNNLKNPQIMQQSIDYFANSFVSKVNYRWSILDLLKVALQRSLQLFQLSLNKERLSQIERNSFEPVIEPQRLLSDQFGQNHSEIKPLNKICFNSIELDKKNIERQNLQTNIKTISLSTEQLNSQRDLTITEKINMSVSPHSKPSKKLIRSQLRAPWKILRNVSSTKKISKIKKIRFKKYLIQTADISRNMSVQQILLKKKDILQRRIPNYESHFSERKRSRQLIYLFS